MATMTPFTFQEDSSLQSQASSLEGRKKLMQALHQAALKGNYQNNATAPYELLGNLATMWITNNAQQKQQVQEAELARKMQQDLMGSATAYMDRRDGKAGETMSDEQTAALMGQDQAPQLAEPVKADPRAALVQAMASQHPELQRMAQLDAQMLMKKKEGPGFKDHTVDGRVVRVYDDGRAQELTQKEKDQWEDGTMINPATGKTEAIQRNKATGQVKTPFGGGTNVTVGGATTVFDKKQDEYMAKETSEIAKKARNDVVDSVSALKNSQQLLGLLDKGELFTGAGAEIKLNVARVASALGVKDYDEKIGDTQAVISQLANATLDTVKRLPGAITEKERPFLEQAAAGQITWTPETLKRLALVNQAMQHNYMLQSMNDYRNSNDRMGDYKGLHSMPTFSYKADSRLQYDPETGVAQLPDTWNSTGAAGSPMATGKAVSGNSGAGSNVIIRKWGGQ